MLDKAGFILSDWQPSSGVGDVALTKLKSLSGVPACGKYQSQLTPSATRLN